MLVAKGGLHSRAALFVLNIIVDQKTPVCWSMLEIGRPRLPQLPFSWFIELGIKAESALDCMSMLRWRRLPEAALGHGA